MNTPNGANATSSSPGPMTKGQGIIAVASGKGGVGKTWFSITLAHAFARMGKGILLFDADLGMANVDIQLGLMPQRDLSGVISGKLTLAQSTIRYDDGNFDIIAGSSGSGGLASLTANRLQALGTDLVNLSGTYDHVIMDLGAGVDRTVRLLAARAAQTVVVISTEPTSLTDAYAFIKLSLQRDADMDLSIVVNSADSVNEGRKTYETLAKACENFLKVRLPLAGVIRRDRKVFEAIRSQTPLLTRSPTSPAAHDVEAIVDHLIGDI